MGLRGLFFGHGSLLTWPEESTAQGALLGDDLVSPVADRRGAGFFCTATRISACCRPSGSGLSGPRVCLYGVCFGAVVLVEAQATVIEALC